MAKRPFTRSKVTPQPEAAPPPPAKTIDEWFDELQRAHPEWDVVTVTQQAFRLAAEQEQAQQQPKPEGVATSAGQARHPRGRRIRLIRGLLALAVLVVIGALVWVWATRARPTETVTSTPTGETQPAATSPLDTVRFADAAPRQVVVGEQVALLLVVTDADGRPLTGQALQVVLSPQAAGTAELSSDGTQVLFTAGATPGDVKLVVRAADDATISTEPLRLTISSAATIALRLEPPAATDLRPGHPFAMRFIVTNSGQTPAADVYLAVDTPTRLKLDTDRTLALTNQACAQTPGGVDCQLEDIGQGLQAAITLYYQPTEAGSVGFSPTHYRLSYAGSDPIVINSTSDTVWSADVPAPQPATLVVSAPAELPANGATQATATVTVLDQWAEPYTSPVRLSLAARRPGATAVAETPTPGLSIRCRTTTGDVLIRERISTEDWLSPRIGEALPVNAELIAWAYRPQTLRLFVEVQEAQPRRGWVTVTLDQTTRIECEGNMATLPPLPPVVNPDGVVEPAGPLDVASGQQTFTYTAGSVSGPMELVAQLVDANNAPIGEPGRAQVTLLEMGWLSTVGDAYTEGGDAAHATGANVLARGLPIGTPLELYPESADTAGARKAAVRIWLPVATLSGGETPMVTTLDEPVRVGATPDDAINTQPDATLRLGDRALNSPVELLGEEVNGYRLARFVVWVAADSVYLDR